MEILFGCISFCAPMVMTLELYQLPKFMGRIGGRLDNLN